MISFHIENIPFKLTHRQKLKEWLKQVVLGEAKMLGDITFIFCSDQYLLSVNKTYLNHDYFTDVITFDYSTMPVIAGDIFISVDTVYINAREYKVSFENELCRVMLHGVLHLCGYKDALKSEQLTMRKKEDLYLIKVLF